jgi:hypothetical protein
MSKDDLVQYIKTMLGESGVDVELKDEDYNAIIKQTLDKISPYYTGRRYIIGSGNVINLSDHNITTIINVFDAKQAQLYSMEDVVLGGENIIVFSNNVMNRIESYTTYKMLWNEIQNLKGVNFRYIEPNLYLDGYSGQVLIEALVRPTSLADIEPNSEFYPWVKDYALAKAKEVVGRIRSKYTVDSSPYQLDGNTLLSEATARMAELEQQLIGTIFVI